MRVSFIQGAIESFNETISKNAYAESTYDVASNYAHAIGTIAVASIAPIAGYFNIIDSFLWSSNTKHYDFSTTSDAFASINSIANQNSVVVNTTNNSIAQMHAELKGRFTPTPEEQEEAFNDANTELDAMLDAQVMQAAEDITPSAEVQEQADSVAAELNALFAKQSPREYFDTIKAERGQDTNVADDVQNDNSSSQISDGVEYEATMTAQKALDFIEDNIEFVQDIMQNKLDLTEQNIDHRLAQIKQALLDAGDVETQAFAELDEITQGEVAQTNAVEDAIAEINAITQSVNSDSAQDQTSLANADLDALLAKLHARDAQTAGNEDTAIEDLDTLLQNLGPASNDDSVSTDSVVDSQETGDANSYATTASFMVDLFNCADQFFDAMHQGDLYE